jgi:hypothetical protein
MSGKLERKFFWLAFHGSKNVAESYGMNCITVTKTVYVSHIRKRETENLDGFLNVKDRGRQEQLLNDTYGTICRVYVSPPHPLTNLAS